MSKESTTPFSIFKTHAFPSLESWEDTRTSPSCNKESTWLWLPTSTSSTCVSFKVEMHNNQTSAATISSTKLQWSSDQPWNKSSVSIESSTSLPLMISFNNINKILFCLIFVCCPCRFSYLQFNEYKWNANV